MKNTFIASLFLIILIFGCKQSPEKIAEETIQKYLDSEQVKYESVTYWTHPLTDEVDTTFIKAHFQAHPNEYFGYNYFLQSDKSDMVYINNELWEVKHSDKSLSDLAEEDEFYRAQFASSNMFLFASPLYRLANLKWNYRQDTSINETRYLNIMGIELDTVFDDKKILAEQHYFIHAKNRTIDRYERRLYHNGKMGQFIWADFANTEFGRVEEPITYDPPQGYVTKTPEKNKEPLELLSEGQQAPDFALLDMDGNEVRLSEYRGRKVFLDFSMINCGWCKIALERFNKPDFEFASNIQPLYINPVDEAAKMEKYIQKVSVPFPVLLGDTEISNAYGVSGYPSFFLIDEGGKIELAFAGYQEELIKKVRKNSGD